MTSSEDKFYTPVSTDDTDPSPELPIIRAERRQSRKRSRILLSIIVLQSILCAGLGAALYGHGTYICNARFRPGSSIVHIPYRNMEFTEQKEYTTQIPGKGSLWDRLIPPGRGFIVAKRTKSGALSFQRHSSKPQAPDPSREFYCLSGIHQMHCLGVIYNATLSHHEPEQPSTAGVMTHTEHIGHCVDYLRQAIMCASDSSLELATELHTDGKVLKSVDGWNTTHQCRDWDSLYNFASEYRLGEYEGIA
ncbi:hypothetical protein BDV25DRAFT_140557 [Aspergillus avenaceus]|uniref:Tat pathway signal sequence n=1 Tax=Aspergillus avenaceus TaxID=36643 RepID=A0A5N6TUB7_ASPAV|nr:hypothetical protein BDV25DRAFT_140557 [Aspergillus avenaceus]